MPSAVFWAGVGGGTEQYRCRTPGSALGRLGWDVRYVEDDDADLRADVVVLQRVFHPHVVDLIRGLQRHGVRVVYDIDDWYDGIPAYNPAASHAAANLDLLHGALAAADLITCSTPELAEGYVSFGQTVVLENYLDPDIWSGNEHYRPPHTAVHVGWMGAAGHRDADLDLLRPWLPGFLEDNPQCRFVLAGSDEKLLADLGIPGLVCPPARSHIRPYEHLPAMLAWFDIGLVPLAQNRFNQAKSWCKGMEYAGMGVPCVASPSREYRRFVQPGRNGELVRGGDWLTPLRKVLADLDRYRQGARETADAHLIDRHIHRWVDAYGRL
jgi:hypothetical protein